MVFSKAGVTLVLAGLLGLANGCNSTPTDGQGPGGSVTPSATALAAVSPAGGNLNVGRGGPFLVAFNGAMLTGMEAYMDVHLGDVGGPVTAMTCTWSADRTTATCRPIVPLDPLSSYALHLGGGMKGSTGTAVSLGPGGQMGGQTVGGEMAGGMHAGQPMTGLGAGWRAADGSYGMIFGFRTGN